MNNNRIEAIVVGAGLNGLGVARSLGRAGTKTTLLETDISQATARSRHVEAVQMNSLSGKEFIDDLIALRGMFVEPPVLILTQEATVLTVSQWRNLLDEKFLYLLPSRDVISTLTTKHGFEFCAKQAGFPIPKTYTLNRPEDLEDIPNSSFPLILKPNERNYTYDRNFSKAYKVEVKKDLEELYLRIMAQAPDVLIIVQEWIEGEDFDIYFCLQYRGIKENSSISFCGRKILSYPPKTGGTASCTASEKQYWPELENLTASFFEKHNVVGLCSMEYKRNRYTDEFVMIKPTIGRTDYQEYISTLYGYNLPAAQVMDLFGLRYDPTPCFAPMIWRDANAEAKSRIMGGKINPQPGKIVDALFSFDDPKPFAVDIWNRIRPKIS